jgi:gamma-butyrobetaine dioxygenase
MTMTVKATDNAQQNRARNTVAFNGPSVPMGDYYPYKTPHRILSVGIDAGDPQVVRLRWSDGRESAVHSLMLRDRCCCLGCRHEESLERTLDQIAYPIDIAPDDVTIQPNGDLRIVWNGDAHVSVFSPGWLRAGGRLENVTPDRPRTLWGRELGENLRKFPYSDILEDDCVLLDWLETMRSVGLVYITGAPTTPGDLRALIARISFIRETNFGGIFDVEAVVDAISNAYTANRLPLHLDLPAREHQPGYQFLHCLSNETSGGGSIYGDGFYMAERLRKSDPEAFALLGTVPIQHRYHDDSCDYVFDRPLIVLNNAGEVVEIRFNTSLMTGFQVPATETRAVYAAYRKFVALTQDSANHCDVMMAAGDIACMDNRRILHGRHAFELGAGRRHLQGAYVEHEEVVSRIRTLRRTIRTD